MSVHPIIKLNYGHLRFANTVARQMARGGTHLTDLDRDETEKREDQVIWCVGEIAFNLYLYQSIQRWLIWRQIRDENTYVGDKGIDVPPYLIDIKASRKTPHRRVEDHNLIVHPREYNPQTVYVSVLVEHDRRTAVLSGWARGSQLEFSASGYFANRWIRKVEHLEEIPFFTPYFLERSCPDILNNPEIEKFLNLIPREASNEPV